MGTKCGLRRFTPLLGPHGGVSREILGCARGRSAQNPPVVESILRLENFIHCPDAGPDDSARASNVETCTYEEEEGGV